MAYFEDLTPYAYTSGRFTESPDAVNIGWIEGRHQFTPAETPVGFAERLADLAKRPVNLMRGSQGCWCGQKQGNGEIRVTGNCVTYASPVLIAHYVAAHQYAPPQAFIDAVMAIPADCPRCIMGVVENESEAPYCPNCARERAVK